VLLSGRQPAVAPPGHGPRLVSFGEPADRRWFPGPLVAAAPSQGFEAEVPAGWEARATWKGFELRPVSQELRRRLVRPAELDTTYLEAFYQPAGQKRYQDGSQLPDSAMLRTPAGPELARGRFAGGRPWFRTDGRNSGLPTNWYVSWPYHCTDGRDCPEVLTLRTLHLSYQVEQAEAAAAAADLAERVLGSARPTGNAVAGRAHAPRPRPGGSAPSPSRWYRETGAETGRCAFAGSGCRRPARFSSPAPAASTRPSPRCCRSSERRPRRGRPHGR
jgi:hypothetical protein